MLIFKNNIYDRKSLGLFNLTRSPDPDYDDWLDPLHFIKTVLSEEEEILSFLERQPREFWREDARKFYPHAHKIGALKILIEFLQILEEGLENPSTWYHMNTYHFCFLYDVLIRHTFNYNHDNREERVRLLPELRGKPIYFELLVKNYFFNTVFLMDKDQYNSLTGEEKLRRGYDCPCLFAVINGLAPTREEMELKKAKDYPYPIYV